MLQEKKDSLQQVIIMTTTLIGVKMRLRFAGQDPKLLDL